LLEADLLRLLPIIMLAVIAGSVVMVLPALFTGAANQPTTLLNRVSGDRSVFWSPSYTATATDNVTAETANKTATPQATLADPGSSALSITWGPPVILAAGIAAAASAYLLVRKSLLGRAPSGTS